MDRYYKPKTPKPIPKEIVTHNEPKKPKYKHGLSYFEYYNLRDALKPKPDFTHWEMEQQRRADEEVIERFSVVDLVTPVGKKEVKEVVDLRTPEEEEKKMSPITKTRLERLYTMYDNDEGLTGEIGDDDLIMEDVLERDRKETEYLASLHSTMDDFY